MTVIPGLYWGEDIFLSLNCRRAGAYFSSIAKDKPLLQIGQSYLFHNLVKHDDRVSAALGTCFPE